MKIYISGRISGLPYSEAYDKFQKAEWGLVAKGYEVVNPIKNGLNINEPWEIHTALNIINLLSCDSIFMLSDFSESRQAMLELNIAELTGKTVIYGEKPLFLGLKKAIYSTFGISHEELIGASKEREFVFARMIFSKICFEEGITTTKIGQLLHRNHSTIIHYLHNYNNDIVYNFDFAQKDKAVREIYTKQQ